MAFKFKLEKVLDYRKQLEEQAMQALAEARATRDAEAARLETLTLELMQQREEMQNSAAMSGSERWLTQNYIQALQYDVEYAQKNLASLEQVVAQRQNQLVEKAQERELLDKLKSRQAKRFADEEKLKEQRENDETATIRFNKATV
ncbi:flagellar export protein FliJ [Desulfovibrio sp. OttesenSCG-928-C06]|nr:flagellar export protein FliJ [Desulfovibrio sp. OttesenSCG-928-C06]